MLPIIFDIKNIIFMNDELKQKEIKAKIEGIQIFLSNSKTNNGEAKTNKFLVQLLGLQD